MSDMFTFNEPIERQRSQAMGGAAEQERADLIDFDVQATDGKVGKVMEATYEAGESYLVVDTGMTLLSKRVVLPAGVVERIDHDERTVYVDRTEDEIKAAPEFDEERYREAAYREELSGYYGR